MRTRPGRSLYMAGTGLPDAYGDCFLSLSCQPPWSGCGLWFTARSNVGCSSSSARPSSRRGATKRNTSTSLSSDDCSIYFCLKTAEASFRGKHLTRSRYILPSRRNQNCSLLVSRTQQHQGKMRPKLSHSSRLQAALDPDSGRRAGNGDGESAQIISRQ
jgi:hypothetical protein